MSASVGHSRAMKLTRKRVRKIMEKALPWANPISQNWTAEYKNKKVKFK